MSAITDITEAWRGHTGLEVETFLKQQITAAIAAAGGKVGYADLEPSTMMLRFFEYQGAQQPMFTVSLGGDIFKMSLNANVESSFYILADETSKVITISPTTQKGSFGSSEYVDYPEDHIFSVEVNNGNGYIPRINPTTIPTGESASFDIRNFISTGDNYIRVSVQGVTSGSSATFVFTAILTTLTLSVGHTWQTPWMEGEPYVINGIRFAGSLVKTLHCSVNGVEQEAVIYTANQSYTTTATNYTIPASAFPASGGSDVYEVKLWMTAQGVSTPEFEFNILCVAEGDDTPLIAINDVTPTVYNWTSGKLFGYAVYNADEASFDLSAILGGITYPVASGVSTSGLLEGTQYEFNYSLEVDTGVNETPIGTLEITGTAYLESVAGDSTTVETTLDNTFSYLPTPNALFYMNASTRSNSEATSNKIINEMGASSDGQFAASYDAEWTGFGWYGDAWDSDNDGYRALVVPAGCLLTVTDFTPLGKLSYEGYREGITFEIMMKNRYPADYNTPVLRIASLGDDPVGLFIYPTKIILLGQYERSEVNQTVNISENRITHITITLVKNYEGVSGRNLASVYINGISNINFAFRGNFGSAPLVIGQPDTDVYVYKIREYGTALDSQSVFNNFLNSIIDGVEFVRRDRSEKNNLLEGGNVDYTKVKAAGFNTMVVQMESDSAKIPSIEYPDSHSGCSIRFEYAGTPEKNVTVSNVAIDGQGTTSKRYFRWNLRAKTGSGTTWEYGDGTSEGGKVGRFINDDSYIKCDRITAKKNYASSMQGHKMGFTGLYNDLYKRVGLGSHLPNSDYQVAVYQFPFVGFRYYELNDSYEFIGLYTAGPDKGSKETFGYSKSAYPNLLSIEGPNHNPRGTQFITPWVDVTYDPSQETLCYGGEEGWDVDYVKYETGYGDNGEQYPEDWAAIRALYESEWKPAYEIAYHCSPHIESLADALSQGGYADIAAVNADLTRFLERETNGVLNSLLSFYDTNYDIWFFRNQTGIYENLTTVEGNNSHNILTYLGLTGTPTTADIKAARNAKFVAEMENYWDLQQTLFHYCFCELFAVSDNHAKNTYPFKYRAFNEVQPEGESIYCKRWGWRQDDMDTVMMTDNNGNNTKSYSVEPGDTISEIVEGREKKVQIFQGFDSSFWRLIKENYPSELKTMMSSIVNAAAQIASSLGIAEGGLHNTLFNLTSYYCWEHSAKYFAETLYEKDRRWSYIQPWLNDPTQAYNGVLPLTQALGDQYQAERLWMERRIAYMFSKYEIGAFAFGGETGYNPIELTLAATFDIHITPAIDLYPIATDAQNRLGGRTEAGEETVITIQASSGSTNNYIKGGDWIASLGDLRGMVLSARGGGDITLSLTCVRLLDLKIGDEDPYKVFFNAETLSLNTPSITEIDARHTTSLNSLVDLSNFSRLRKVLFEGSGATGLFLAIGAKVTELSFPEASRSLFLHSLPYLQNDKLKLPRLAGVNEVMIYNCDTLDAMSVLRDILLEDNNTLEYVTAVWRNTLQNDSRVFYTLVSLLGISGYVTYENGSTRGIGGIPIVTGEIDITKTLYRAFVPPELNISSDEAYGENYRKMTVSNFNSDLSIIYDPLRMYPDPFVDDGYVWCYYNVTTTESATTLLYSTSVVTQFGANFIIDGVEVPRTNTYTFSTTGVHLVKMQRAAGTLTANTYRAVTTLIRIYLPTGVLTGNTCFYGCTNLTHCWLPLSTTRINDEVFVNCSKLDNLNLYLPNCTYLGTRAVYNTKALRNSAVYMPKLTSTSTAPFAQSYLVAWENLGSLTYMGSSSQAQDWGTGCTALKKVVLPPSLYSIYKECFYNCTALEDINLDNPYITRLAWGVFQGCTSLRVEVNLTNLVYMNNRNFNNSRVTKVRSLGRVRSLYSETNNVGCFQSNTALSEITLPYTLTALGNMCFDGCTALKTITCYALVPPTVGSNAFRNVTPNKIYVPFDSVLAYRAASGWSAFATKIEPIPNSQSPLPDEYKLLPYVATDSNAWVDTGVAGATDLEIGITALWSTFVQGGALYGNYIDDLHNVNRVILDSSTSFDVAGGANLNNSITRNETGVVNELIVNATHNVLNGFKRAITPSTTLANTDNICLGNRSVTDPVEANIGQLTYDFWIRKAGVEILHYYPCERLSDNKRGFYDLVNNVFKPSDTEVDFT